jgi:hypothetical protein
VWTMPVALHVSDPEVFFPPIGHFNEHWGRGCHRDRPKGVLCR